MGSGPPFKVTKLGAARRQLRTSIELWFLNGDPVSIHTLAFAAHEILHRLLRVSGDSDLLFDSSLVRPEYRKEFARLLKEDANFFKHAERDGKPDETKDFRPARNNVLIAVSIAAIQRMGISLEDEEHAFLFWMSLHFPMAFRKDTVEESIPIDNLDKMKATDKHSFFRAFLEVRRQYRAMGLIE